MMTKPPELKPAPASRAVAEHWPKAAVSVALFRGDAVLLIERSKGIRAGYWSLPGGHIEPGETALAAAARELIEETGLSGKIDGLADIQDVIVRDADGRLQAHYLLAVFFGRWAGRDPVAASDARDARFVVPAALAGYTLTPGTQRLISLAAAKLQL